MRFGVRWAEGAVGVVEDEFATAEDGFVCFESGQQLSVYARLRPSKIPNSPNSIYLIIFLIVRAHILPQTLF